VKIDTDRMTGGRELALRLRGSERGGIPWMTILDEKGEKLITSDGPKGNIGYPFEPHEIDYFLVMLKQTGQHMSSERLAEVERALREAADRLRKR
jgi:hypothetical protein